MCVGSKFPTYNHHQYVLLQESLDKARKGILLGKHKFDLLRFVSLYAKDFVKEHPVSIVEFINSASEKHFYEAISVFYNRLICHKVTIYNRGSTLESLIYTFNRASFHVLLVCLNCCEAVLKLSDWYRFDHSLPKVTVVFLTTSKQSLNRFSHHSLPDLDDNSILELLNVPESEREEVFGLQLVQLCDRSVVELEIVDAFRQEKQLSFAQIKEASQDEGKKEFLFFKQEWIRENLDDCFQQLFSKLKLCLR